MRKLINFFLIVTILIAVYLLLIVDNSENVQLMLADEQYSGNSIIFETNNTKNPEIINEIDVQNYIVEINDKIKLAINDQTNESMAQLMQSIDELLIENGFISVETIEESSIENAEDVFISKPLIYFNEKTNVYLISSTFQWSVGSSGKPNWLNESNNVEAGEHNIPGEIQDIFRIKISTDAENTAEIVNETSFLVTFSKGNENFIYDTPREITPSLVEYQGNDYYFYSNLDGEELLDYSWDHGIMFYYIKSKEGIKYKVEPEYPHFYYKENDL